MASQVATDVPGREVLLAEVLSRCRLAATATTLMTDTFFILGDQLSFEVDPWPTLPRDTVILMIESNQLIAKPRHLTRVALYLASMRQFATEARTRGYVVDYRVARNFTEGLTAHRTQFQPTRIFMNEPRGRRARTLFSRCDIDQLPDPFYLTDVADFRQRAKQPATLESFQREQRQRLNVLMHDDKPVGGQWNFDLNNREPLPRDGGSWPAPWSAPVSAEERALISELSATHVGDDALMFWPRNRDQALEQLQDAVTRIIPRFGPHEDAASADNWHLAHSRLSPALNMGLLHPREVIDAVVEGYENGAIPLPSAEGFIRQVLGWREWVWLLHHLRSDAYDENNYFHAQENLPVAWRDMSGHPMRCIDGVLSHLRHYGWNHHIERLMILANAATLAEVNPRSFSNWMIDSYVDGAEWVMEANVIGMGTFADGGQTSTKPYIGGGNYISKMTNYCKGCAFSPTERTGDKACPLTTLYWDFLIRNEALLAPVHRLAPQRRAALARHDRVEIQEQAPRAREIILRGHIATND